MRPYFFTAMLMLASTGLMGGLTFMPRDGESVAVIFPSGTSREAAVEKVLAAGWLPVGVLRGSVVLAFPSERSMSLRQSGALLILDGRATKGCLSF
ncbi:MAG: hypothetical protein KJ904_03830 [Alphaproteobacteria bacterium]|nr:hypothetical protein [Alphaproteobacteria bacterium]MBU0795586.1 hypothetical protein [Alphaproteobacteria bacterium]MBU0886271.1 hypothetical protein [Alphaproteobacteria bacterium]MBU1815116.1 hypothetical protein [Alphaproteobacteria bacterium]